MTRLHFYDAVYSEKVLVILNRPPLVFRKDTRGNKIADCGLCVKVDDFCVSVVAAVAK